MLPLFLGAADTPVIDWQDWGQASFEQARQENKMVLIDVGMEGCTACRWMDEITYTNPEVVELVKKHFVSIVVDAESRPDIGERYSDWAWPATIFLAPDTTQVLALRGNRIPRNFVPILNELITKHEAGQLEPDELAPYAAPPEPETTDLTRIRDRVRGRLDRNLNDQYGGWSGRGISTDQGSQLQHLYMRAHMYGLEELQSIAIKTTDGYLQAMDPVWGGVYVFANDNGFIPEKRISNQANALAAFANAYQITADAKYAEGIENIDRYLRDWMMAPDGAFYTSQEDDAPNLPRGMGAVEYYLLDSGEDRLRYGVPPIDHAVHTDKNGQAIAAYVRAYEATGQAAYLATAIRAANALSASRLVEAGWILQTRANAAVNKDNRIRPLAAGSRPFLSAQAWFGTALLALYRATGDEQWLSQAKAIAMASLEQLEDDALGGFFATKADTGSDVGVSILAPRKPLEHNATAAHFLYDLWVYTKDEQLASLPERTLRAVAVPGVVRREGKVTGQLAIALEKVTADYVEFSVVGDNTDPNAESLFEAARVVYEPRKLLHYEAPGRYPDRGRPAMYICNPDRCSLPIESADDVARTAQQFRKPGS
jgi:hypothetical protein